MKAISLWSPWAQWVIMNWKGIETRYHQRFKGLTGQRIAIHAAKKLDKEALIQGLLDREPALTALETENMIRYVFMTRGTILGTVLVSDALWAPNVDFTEREEWNRKAMCDVSGKFCLFMNEVKPLPRAVPFIGRQGIFEVPEELLSK